MNDILKDPKLRTVLKNRFMRTAVAIAKEAKALVRRNSYKTGRLHDSIRTLIVGWEGCSVGSDVPYAGIVELGTSTRAAEPYLAPALDLAALEIKRIWRG